jgi:uncharacterized repeat protein (TIGR01451 family)
MALVCVAFPAPASADRAFTPRFSTNLNGNFRGMANTLMTCPVATPGCTDAQAGVGSSLNNNNWVMARVDQDSDPATTLDSSSATLSLPPGATVLFAGLYYGAVTAAGTRGTSADAGLRASVKLKAPGDASYSTLTASVLDVSSSSSDGRYQGFVDVTSQVSAAGSGVYWVGDVQEATGEDRYGGWAIIVAYQDPTEPSRSLTVFDGLSSVTSGGGDVVINLSGFRTSAAGPVRTRLGVLAYEGDRGATGDSLTLDTTTISDSANPPNNFFDSAISSGGVDYTAKDPNYVNQFGFDAVFVDADGVLPNGATDAKITLKTSSDQYFPGMVAFSTELFAPSVQSTKSVANITQPGGPNARGDTLRYTVTETNTGQDGAANFEVRDAIPAGTTYVPGSLRILSGPGPPIPTDGVGDDQAEFSPTDNAVLFRLGQNASASTGGLLAPGASTSLSFDVTIDGDLPARDQIVNSATATFIAQSLGNALTSITPDVTTVVDAPDLTIAKSHSGSFVGGATTPFMLTVSNAGTIATDGSPVTVADNFPSGATGFDSISVSSAPGWTCTIAAGTTSLTCTRNDPLTAGSSYPPIVVAAVVHDPAPSALSNTVTVAGGGDSEPTNNQATDTAVGTSLADLSITKVSFRGRAKVPSGAEGGFVLTVRNLGPSAASDVVVNDPSPAGVTVLSVAATQGGCTAALVCELGAIAPGGTATVTVAVKITANDTTLTNIATVASSTPDSVPGNNTASLSVVVAPTTNLVIAKSVAANPAASAPTAGLANGAVYTLSVHNAGPLAATNVGVIDLLPSGFTPSAVSAPGFTCNVPGAGGTLSCSRSTLTVADGTLTITITGTLDAATAGRLVTNLAAVEAEQAELDPSDNVARADTTPIPYADLELTKTVPPGAVAPNGTVTFTLGVLDNGPSQADAVTLTDTLPAGLTFLSGSPGCSAIGAAVTCAVGTLAAGATATVSVTAQAATGASGQTLTNIASASSTTPDPVASNNADTAAIEVRPPSADLALTKTATRDTVSSGDTVSFALDLENNGPDPAEQTVVTDILPAGLTFVSASPGCTASSAIVTCQVGTLPTETTRTLTITARATAAGQTLANSASATSTTPDPATSNNTASAAVVIAAGASPPAAPPTSPAPTPPSPAPAPPGSTQGTPPPVPRSWRCAGRPATILGTAGPDHIRGTPHRDVIVGLAGNDVINSLGGNDLVCAGPGTDIVHAGFGNDVIYGGRGHDVLYGGPGNDRIYGGGVDWSGRGGHRNDDDTLIGGTGTDRLFGGPGNDHLDGGRGHNLDNGDSGRDRCVAGKRQSCEY